MVGQAQKILDVPKGAAASWDPTPRKKVPKIKIPTMGEQPTRSGGFTDDQLRCLRGFHERYGYSASKLARALGKSEYYIYNLLNYTTRPRVSPDGIDFPLPRLSLRSFIEIMDALACPQS